MSYVTVEVRIDHGRIVPSEPEKLPEKAIGLLTILSPADGSSNDAVAAAALKSWPAGYFDKTAGAFANEAFERPAPLPFEKRAEW